MKSLFGYLQNYLQQATESEREIIHFWLENIEKCRFLNVRQLASETYTSASTVIRLCQKLGFKGYKELKDALIYEAAMLQRENQREIKDLTKEDSLEHIIEKVTYRNITSLEGTAQNLNIKIIKDCVRLIEEARVICLFGLGTSLLAARDFSLKLIRMNKICQINDDWHVQWLMAKNITNQDLAIVFSYSEMTHEMIQCVQTMKRMGTKIISICGFEKSTIAKMADYNLGVITNEHTFRNGAMSSRIAQLNIIDILFNAYINQNYESSLKQVSKTHILKDDERERSRDD